MITPGSRKELKQGIRNSQRLRSPRVLPTPSEIDRQAAAIRRTWPKKRLQRKADLRETEQVLNYLLTGCV